MPCHPATNPAIAPTGQNREHPPIHTSPLESARLLPDPSSSVHYRTPAHPVARPALDSRAPHTSYTRRSQDGRDRRSTWLWQPSIFLTSSKASRVASHAPSLPDRVALSSHA